jgi:D-alanyl-D-alanine carboxypeptidase/D-alanyl-D-alanine-endopeptidase (penicillin-binding protein 4)
MYYLGLLMMPLTLFPFSPEKCKAINVYLEQPAFSKAAWGVLVKDQVTGDILYSYNSDKFFIPCSVSKLFTASTALDYLGEDYCIKTSVFTDGTLDADGVLNGNLILYGRGDPELGLYSKGRATNTLQSLAEALRAKGIRVIKGNIIGDDHFFNTPFFSADCEWEDTHHYYACELSALSLNSNCAKVIVKPAGLNESCMVQTLPSGAFCDIDNRTHTGGTKDEDTIEFFRFVGQPTLHIRGTLSIDQNPVEAKISIDTPALFAARFFRKILKENAIEVEGVAQAATWFSEPSATDCSALNELAACESPKLKIIVQNMLKSSDNLSAQLLALQVGAYYRDHIQLTKIDSSSRTDIQALEAAMKYWKKNTTLAGCCVLRDGNGLSRHNLLTPEAVVELLSFVQHKPYFDAIYEGLPIAGKDGTLKNRFKGTYAQNNLRAKTGFMSGNRGLAGFVHTKDNQQLIICLFLNNYVPLGEEAPTSMEAIDHLVSNLLQ